MLPLRPGLAAGRTRAELIQEKRSTPPGKHAISQDWLFQTIEFPLLQQQKFHSRGMAMGLSLNQTLVLSVILLGVRAAPLSSSRSSGSSLGPSRR